VEFLDKKFKQKFPNYLIQCGIAAAVIVLVLMFLNMIEHTGLVAALGATTFMIFTMPHRVSCRARYVVGGYILGIAVGIAASQVYDLVPAWHTHMGLAITGGVAVGLSGLLMAATNSEHPPGAGVALGLVLQPWDYETVFFVLASVIVLSLVKNVLRRFMIDLL
jgi:CBS-domain-containing membrane protein